MVSQTLLCLFNSYIAKGTLAYQRCSSFRCELSPWWWWYLCHRNMSELKWSSKHFALYIKFVPYCWYFLVNNPIKCTVWPTKWNLIATCLGQKATIIRAIYAILKKENCLLTIPYYFTFYNIWCIYRILCYKNIPHTRHDIYAKTNWSTLENLRLTLFRSRLFSPVLYMVINIINLPISPVRFKVII
jgi:hypothetical protein